VPATSVRSFRLSNPPLIAIVDDDDAVREALFDLLQVEGLAARKFANGAAFLADAAADRFDCIVTDVRMPEVDGLELQRRLRAGGSCMPVIFLTSSVEEATRARALEEGAAAWLTKPVADEALLRALRSALDQDRSLG
jgi:two-component system, LuxR family, response regulator FixJ